MSSTYIIEPNCKSFSHETINSFYIFKYIKHYQSLGYTCSLLTFESHYACIESFIQTKLSKLVFTSLHLDYLLPNKILYFPTFFPTLRLLIQLIRQANPGDHFIFLSITKYQFYFIYLFVFFSNVDVSIDFLLHSNLDTRYGLPIHFAKPSFTFKSLAKYIRANLYLFYFRLNNTILNFSRYLPLLPYNSRIRCILLSDHILTSIPPRIRRSLNFIPDNISLDIQSIPISPYYANPNNRLTLATLGYGNPDQFNAFTKQISQLNLPNISLMVIGGNPHLINPSPLISFYPRCWS